MNRCLKNLLSCTTALILVSGLLAGCGESTSQQNTGNSTSQTKLTSKVDLTLWVAENSATQKALNQLNDEFHQKNPLITVKISQYNLEDMRKNFINTSVAGSGPDIVLGPGDNIGVFETANVIQPITDIVGKDYLSKFSKESVNAATYKGKVWELPDRISSGLFLIYNKKYVTEVPKTFEKVEEAGKQLQTAGKVQYGLTFDEVEPYYSSMFMNCFGAKFFDNINAKSPKAVLGSAAMVKWAQFLTKMHNDGVIPKEADANVSDNLFEEGKTAFIISGPWSFSTYKKAGVDFGVTTLPTANGKDIKPLSSISGFAVSSNVKDDNKKLAVKTFLKFMSSESSQLTLADAHGKLPTNNQALKSSKFKTDPMYAVQTEQFKKCLPMPIIPQMRAIWDAMRPVQQDLLSGKVSASDAPKQMQTKAEEGIKNLGVQ